MKLDDFSSTVVQLPSMQWAQIVSTECHIGCTKSRHRYLILELDPPRSQRPLWLRIDRRPAPGGSFVLLSGFFTSQAHDTVSVTRRSVSQECYWTLIIYSLQAILSVEKHALIGLGDKRENLQVFSCHTSWALSDFCIILQTIILRNPHAYVLYKVGNCCSSWWCPHASSYAQQENCWFFASFLQQLLGGSDRGRFILGGLPQAHWAPTVRRRLILKTEQLYFPDDPPLSVSLPCKSSPN